MELGWQWEAKAGVWSDFDAAAEAQLNAAKGARVSFSAGPVNMTAELGAMTQTNKATGFQRRIRCLLKDDQGKFWSWEWADDAGCSWSSFAVASAQALEKARAADAAATVQLSIAGRSYDLDLAAMTQTNTATKVKRAIRRCAVLRGEAAAPAIVEPLRRSSRSRSQKSTGNGAVKEEKAEEEEEEKPTPSSSKQSKSIVAKSEAKSTKRKLVVKGRAAVDPECQHMVTKAHVYEEGADVYDAMLNQTNLQNNNNKYYIIQLLEEEAKRAFHVWLRWGRVGFKGQSSLVACGGDLEQAKGVFCQKFADKTKNEWGSRAQFAKVAGKYDLVHVDYAAAAADETETKKLKKEEGEEEKPPVESKLPESVQGLMKLICDVSRMEAAVKEMEYDAEKAPLGKLTTVQIKAGYAALKDVEECISPEGKRDNKKLLAACNNYYTRIPHCFGMRTPPLIRDMAHLRRELALMEALADIEVAVRTIAEGKAGHEDLHPIDRNYAAMKCELKPLPKEDAAYKVISRYLVDTHGPTHVQYKMRVKNIFALRKDGEEEAFKSDIQPRQLLWHGSRLTNWYGILSQGLRIAPPEAPVTGYMFGKGVYFADVSSKSANYCFPSKANPTGLLLLCDVATGTPETVLHAKYDAAEKLKAGAHSIFAKGSIVPDPAVSTTLGGAKVPYGKPVSVDAGGGGFSLNYNEFVVYDTAHIRMAYAVETDFVF